MRIKGKIKSLQSKDRKFIHNWTDEHGGDSSVTIAEIDISAEALAKQLSSDEQQNLIEAIILVRNKPQSQECKCLEPKHQYNPNVPNWCLNCGKPIAEKGECKHIWAAYPPNPQEFCMQCCIPRPPKAKIEGLMLMDLGHLKTEMRQDLWFGEVVNKINELINRYNMEW